MTPHTGSLGQPDVSFVMPCYNEEQVVTYTITRLMSAFRRSGYELELVAVDNGSSDRTGSILDGLAAEDPLIRPVRVLTNQGYGHGVLTGLPHCQARWVGIIPADGQVDAEDVVKLYEAIESSDGRTVAKVRRRFRMDGVLRTAVSTFYNLFVRLLWPRLASIDVNGSPKILARDVVTAMQLESKGWLLDPEVLIKAHYMGLRILEFSVFARMRGSGLSHVRPGHCWEFFRQLLVYRFSGYLSEWSRRTVSFGTTPASTHK